MQAYLPSGVVIQIPTPAAELHTSDAPFLDLGCEHRAEPMPPLKKRFMTGAILSAAKGCYTPDFSCLVRSG
jgi:hypothetical protein